MGGLGKQQTMALQGQGSILGITSHELRFITFVNVTLAENGMV